LIDEAFGETHQFLADIGFYPSTQPIFERVWQSKLGDRQWY
jgi:hypothetical protein